MIQRLRLLLLVCAAGPAAFAQDMPVYYDYLENGALRGGKFHLDVQNPDHRRTFGLDGHVAAGGWPSTTVIDNGPTANRIDIVVLGDGYTSTQQGTYAGHVQNVLAAFFDEEPLAAYATYFNVHRVDVESNQSGVDEMNLNIYRDTALDMAYGCFSIDRLLCINVTKAWAAAAAAPQVDQVLALAKSTRYGGAGYPNLGTLAGNNGSAIEIALHEFGHAFAGLADEYDYADGATYAGGDPGEPNVSIYTAPIQQSLQRKWYRWLNLGHVHAYEGAAYYQFGLYRPTVDSKMRSLNRPFEEVNVEQFVLTMYEYVSPVDDMTPPSASSLSPCKTLFVEPLQPVDHDLQVQWAVDGVDVVGATLNTLVPNDVPLTIGVHGVSVRVVDTTPRVRDEGARDALMTVTGQWSVEVTDDNNNGTPDLCEWVQPGPLEPDAGAADRNRAVVFTTPSAAVAGTVSTAIEVRLDTLYDQTQCPPRTVGPDLSLFEGEVRWLGPPQRFPDEAVPAAPDFIAAELGCCPHFRDWTDAGLDAEFPGADLSVVHAFGAAVVPCSTYTIRAVDVSCPDLTIDECFSAPIEMQTAEWGDVAEPVGLVSFVDIGSLVNKFKKYPYPAAPRKPGAMLRGNVPPFAEEVGFLDIGLAVNAYKLIAYAEPGPSSAECAAPCP